MAARRLLIVMLILLGVSTLAAALAPPQAERDDDTTATETETGVEPPGAAGRLPPGRLLRAEITVGGRRRPVVPVRLGDQLVLVVRSRRAGEVEIPKLGLIQSVDPFSPARFDILAEEAGRYPIRLAGTRRVVGGIVVRARSRARGRRTSRRARRGAS